MIVKFVFFVATMLLILGCKMGTDGNGAILTPPALFKGALIPLYAYPTGPQWKALLDINTTVEIITIINPNNGPVDCNTTISQDYQVGIAQLKSKSIKAIGYVHTLYAARPIEEVKADVARYRECYSNLDGIFVDEANASAQSALYYQELSSFIKVGNSSQKVVLNTGTYPDEEIVRISDITVIYEKKGIAYDALTPPEYITRYPSEKFALLGYGVPQTEITSQKFQRLNTFKVGYVYLTNDNTNNPWDTLTAYYISLMEMLSSKLL